jgi:hypothetical protein
VTSLLLSCSARSPRPSMLPAAAASPLSSNSAATTQPGLPHAGARRRLRPRRPARRPAALRPRPGVHARAAALALLPHRRAGRTPRRAQALEGARRHEAFSGVQGPRRRAPRALPQSPACAGRGLRPPRLGPDGGPQARRHRALLPLRPARPHRQRPPLHGPPRPAHLPAQGASRIRHHRTGPLSHDPARPPRGGCAQRLSRLIPQHGRHMVTYHGVLASAAR